MRMILAKGRGWRLPALAVAIAAVGVSSAMEREGAPRELSRMHDDAVLAFIDSEGFGMRRLPAMSKILHRQVKDTHWFIAHLELIGVAKHDPPQVFSNEMSIFHRPDKDMPPPRAMSRAITTWEGEALRNLDAGQDLVVANMGAGLRVVGAIRAGDECLGCHKNKRAGDVLGAFVYVLQPLPTEMPAK